MSTVLDPCQGWLLVRANKFGDRGSFVDGRSAVLAFNRDASLPLPDRSELAAEIGEAIDAYRESTTHQQLVNLVAQLVTVESELSAAEKAIASAEARLQGLVLDGTPDEQRATDGELRHLRSDQPFLARKRELLMQALAQQEPKAQGELLAAEQSAVESIRSTAVDERESLFNELLAVASPILERLFLVNARSNVSVDSVLVAKVIGSNLASCPPPERKVALAKLQRELGE